MKLTDEARAAGLAALHGDSEWHKSDGAGVWRANYGRAVDLVLAAALPHLTDDGAAATPPADSTGVGAPAAAESATTTAAPSSPHPTTPRSPERGRIANALAGSEVIVPGYEYLVHAQAFRVADVLLAAGLFPEGATPGTNHRPTCGTTYGESCDGYCPTPAIDREAIAVALHDADWHHQWGAANCEFFECQDVSLQRADVVLALIGPPNSGASEDDQ